MRKDKLDAFTPTAMNSLDAAAACLRATTL
jgi:hypothetical protein